MNEKCPAMIGALLALALLAGCAPGQVERPANTATPIRPPTAPPPTPPLALVGQRDASGHYYKGNRNARVVLEEWTDLQ
ncbi:MAG: hypothetical protein HYX92_06350 [Chloroflexi bacterium]|nr:hypothetical protein [Chloroflexota bacterium]